MKKRNTPVLYMPEYTGTIMKRCLSGEDTIYDNNATFQYDELNNCYFYYTVENLRELLFSIGKALENTIDEELDKKVDGYFLTTDIPNIDGALYIDVNSLREKKNGKSRR